MKGNNIVLIILAIGIVFVAAKSHILEYNYSGVVTSCDTYGKFVWDNRTFICKEQK